MTSLPGFRLLRMPGLFCAVLCQLMQQRRVGCALNPAARAEDQTGTGRCDLRGKKPAAGIALTMGIGFRAKRCFFKWYVPGRLECRLEYDTRFFKKTFAFCARIWYTIKAFGALALFDSNS